MPGEMFGPTELCEWLLAQVLADLDNAGRRDITTSYVGAGVTVWDDCCGQLVVSPGRIYRSVSFPAEAGGQELCDGGMIVVPMTVQLVRCVPTIDDRGNLPDPDIIMAQNRLLLDDAAVVWRSMLRDLPDEDWERAVVAQQFIGAEGGCIEVQTSMLIGLNQDQWCGPLE